MQFTEALRLDPTRCEARLEVSAVLLELERAQAALDAAEAFIACQPRASEGYQARARALRALGREAKATEAAREEQAEER